MVTKRSLAAAAIAAFLVASLHRPEGSGATVSVFSSLHRPAGIPFYVDPAAPGAQQIRAAMLAAGMDESRQWSAHVVVSSQASPGELRISMRDVAGESQRRVFEADVRAQSGASSEQMAAEAMRGFPFKQGVQHSTL